MPKLLVIQHVPHERLGTFEPVFKDAGVALACLNADDPKAAWPGLESLDGIITMGGPQSVYERKKYPYLAKELALLEDALNTRMPILGVCLGAQLLAEAIGGPGTVRKAEQPEIGWYPLMRSPSPTGDARHSATRDAPASLHEPLFSIFESTETVFQWHGDTFALPKGAVRLASSPLCPEQAFRYRDNVYALQFHLEVTEAMVRAWMLTPVNKAELARLRGIVDPIAIRRQSRQHVERLQELSRHVAGAFVELLGKAPAGARGTRRGARV